MNLWQETMQKLDAQPAKVRLPMVSAVVLLLALGSIQMIGSLYDNYRQQVEILRMQPELGKKEQQAMVKQLATNGNPKVQMLKQQVEAAARELDSMTYARLDAVRESEAGADILQRAIESLLRNPGKLKSVEVKRMPVKPLLPDANETKPAFDVSKASSTTKLTAKEQALDEQAEAVVVKLEKMNADRLYKHGMRLTLYGAWFDLLELLEELEDVSPQLFWQSFELHSDEYPYSKLTLTLFTVSAEAI